MPGGGHIAWVRLILGTFLALLMLSAAVLLVGPVIYTYAAGGMSLRIRDDGMAPSLLPGDWVLARPLTPGAPPRRGSLVIYRLPAHPVRERVGRVVALPGERVQMRGGVLYVNGRRAAMERAGARHVRKTAASRIDPVPACINDLVPPGGPCRQEIWRETLPDGPTALVLNSHGSIGVIRPPGAGDADNTRPVVVPSGHVWILGDNRDNVEDSRSHGPVPLDHLEGRLWLIDSSLVRAGRFFRPRWERFLRRLDR